MDDGSTDNTLITLRKFKCDFLKVVTQENKGACAARNFALSLANGDFIQWLDSDDLLSPHKIENQLKAINYDINTRILLSSSCAKFYLHPDKAEFISNSLWQNLAPRDWLNIRFRQETVIYQHAWLVSRKISDIAGKWDERLLVNQDGEYFCRIVAASDFVKFVPEAKCYYRIGNITSTSNKRSKKNLESLIQANSLCVDHLLKLENSAFTREASLIFLQKFISNVYYEEDELENINQIKDRITELGGKIPIREESRKFRIIRRVLGLRIARNLKSRLWNLEIIFRKYIDKII